EAPRLVLGHGAGEADDEVAAREVRLVGRDHVRVLDRRDGRWPAGRRPRVRVALEQRPPEGEVREGAVAVARVDELGRRLAAKTRDLVAIERGLPEDAREQLDEGREVAPDD